ncbi:hypothetical protein M406DRAFT_355765 [Cryphonectria parasitica EP155]|uniref:Uncharacterized protein n=1 Tax=Cryphonectria parasitica (strain ATCC 38755 / EP155) TaxID=660469 RepID=A0A9P5CR62_CRYP1|nr:uncharacterized protein M406DRAFT_355765 [Cryphonectria parasitica EP155]KAF3767928.1 hypothetical protein M406DRAFT_355765 [Cryphonectria parasitica EP155]
MTFSRVQRLKSSQWSNNKSGTFMAMFSNRWKRYPSSMSKGEGGTSIHTMPVSEFAFPSRSSFFLSRNSFCRDALFCMPRGPRGGRGVFQGSKSGFRVS